MRITAISGSSRRGNCHRALEIFLEAAAGPRVETELIDLSDKTLGECNGACHETCHPRDGEGRILPGGWFLCTRRDDGDRVLDAMVRADALVLATPVLFGNFSARLKTLMERSNALCTFDRGANHSFLAGKPAAAIAVGGARHGGQELALAGLVNYFMAVQMVPVGLAEYQGALGLSLVKDSPGHLEGDLWTDYEFKEMGAVECLRAYGKKMADLLLAAEGGRTR